MLVSIGTLRPFSNRWPHFSLPVLYALRTAEADLPQLLVCCWPWSLLYTSPLHPAVFTSVVKSTKNTVPWFSLLFCFWVKCFAFPQIVQSLMPHAYFLQKWLSPGDWSRAVNQLGLEARDQRKAFSPTVPFSIPLYLVPVSSISPLTLSIKPRLYHLCNLQSYNITICNLKIKSQSVFSPSKLWFFQ